MMEKDGIIAHGKMKKKKKQIIPSGGRNSTQGWNPETETEGETMTERYLLTCFLQLSQFGFSHAQDNIPRDAAAHLGPHATIVT